MNLQKGESYDLSKLAFAGWSTPVGFRHSMDGYHYLDYFDGPTVDRSRYLGADTFGVEPLFETL